MNSNTNRSPNASSTFSNGKHYQFGPGGCQAIIQGKKCGETRTLEIIGEFKRLYEKKMKQIDAEAGGDCIQAKINLQQDWIRDLSEQNDMLVKAVEELECEAAQRVTMLEEKLKNTSKCACEHQTRLKDKDNKIKELEAKLKKVVGDGAVEDVIEAKKVYNQYSELKKDTDNQANVQLQKLYEDNLKLHKEVQLLQTKLDNVNFEIRSTACMVHKAIQTTDNFDLPEYLKDIRDIMEDSEQEKLLVVGLEKEVRNMLSEMYSKDKQLLDQKDLITLLVQKLFIVYKSLVELEEKTRKCFEDTDCPDNKRCNLINKYKNALLSMQKIMIKSIEQIEKKKKKQRDGGENCTDG